MRGVNPLGMIYAVNMDERIMGDGGREWGVRGTCIRREIDMASEPEQVVHRPGVVRRIGRMPGGVREAVFPLH